MPSDGSPRGRESDRERSLDYSERSPSRSPVRSRSRSPARRASPAAAGGGGGSGSGSWRDALEALYSKGTVRRGDLDEGILASIDALREDEAACVIQRLDETDLTRIRNVNGFVGGIIRRVKADGPDRGEANVGVLPEAVQKQLDELVEDRKLERREVDHRMVRALSELKEGQAEEALRRFADSVDDTIRSRQGFLMGIIKRMNGNGRGRPPPSRYGGGGGGRNDRGGDRRDRDRDRDRDRGRYDDRRDIRGYEPRGPPPSRGYDRGHDRYDDRRGGGGYDDRRYDDRRGGGGPPPPSGGYEPRGGYREPPPPRDFRGGPPSAYEPRGGGGGGGYDEPRGGRYGDRPRY